MEKISKEGLLVIIYLSIFLFVIFYLLKKSYEGFRPILQSGNTRLMSYDIRGDMPITRYYTGPWMNPETGPIYNRPLII